MQELASKVNAYADVSLEAKVNPSKTYEIPSGIQKKNKINIEAYHAYYNNTENQ